MTTLYVLHGSEKSFDDYKGIYSSMEEAVKKRNPSFEGGLALEASKA